MNAGQKDGLIAAVLSAMVAFSNFAIQHYAGNFFGVDAVTVQFLKDFSIALLVSSSLSFLVCFRKSPSNMVIVDHLLLISILSALLLLLALSSGSRLAAIGLAAMFFCRDLFRYAGTASRDSSRHNKTIRVATTGVFGGAAIALAASYCSYPFAQILLSFLLGTNCLFFICMSINSGSFERVKGFFKPNEFFHVLIAEALPLVAAYLILIHSASLMSAVDYVQFRSIYAFVGIASVLGSVSLVYFSRIVSSFRVFYITAAVLALFCLVLILPASANTFLTTILLITVTAVVALSSSILRTRVPKWTFALVNGLAPAIAIAFVVLSTFLEYRDLLIMVVIVHSLQVLAGCVAYYSVAVQSSMNPV
jgi:hypothetical protein